MTADENKTSDSDNQPDNQPDNNSQIVPETNQNENIIEDSLEQSTPDEDNRKPLIMKPHLGTDWSKEIQTIFTDLAPVLCDSPDKCQLLILRLTLRDGSQYMVSGHGQNKARLPDGSTYTITMHFVGQDQQNNGVAVAVRPQDILKVELVDLPNPDMRPSFGFARHMKDQVIETTHNPLNENMQIPIIEKTEIT